MASVIDALVVTLGLDSSKFTTGRKQVSDDLKRTKSESDLAAKAIEESGRRAAEFFRRLKNEAIALFAVFAGARGLADLVRDITTTDAVTGRLAHNLGMSTDQLSAWEGAARRAGGSAEATAGSFDSLTQHFQQFALTGERSVVPYLRTLGIQVADAQGKLRPLGDILLDLADKFKKMDPRTATTFGRALGLDQGTINLLEQGREAVTKLLEEQKKLGLPSDADAGRAQGLLKQFMDIQQGIQSLARTVLNDLTPTISHLLQQLDDWLQKNREWLAQKITEQLKEWVGYIQGIDWNKALSGIKDVGNAVLDIVRQIHEMISYVASFKPPEWLMGFLSWKPPPWLMQPGVGADGKPDATTREGGYTGLSDFDKFLEWLKRNTWFDHDKPAQQAPTAANSSAQIAAQIAMDFAARIFNFSGGASGAVTGGSGRVSPAAYTTTGGGSGGSWGGGSGGTRSGGDKNGKTAISGMGAAVPAGGVPGAGDQRIANLRGMLMRDLGLSRDQAAGILSNLQAESGIAGINERHPLVPGSRGGFGWAQWTGPRRVAFEAWAKEHGMNPASDAANYGFLLHELQTKYGRTLQAIRGARTAGEAATHFFRGYESGGAASLERWLGAHTRNAERYAQLPDAAGGMMAGTHPKTPLRSAAADLLTGARARAAGWGQSVTHNNTSHEVSVGQVTVHTQAKDAQGIAKGIGQALKNTALASQANYALA